MKYLLFAVAILGLLSCGKNINNKEAVKAAIEKRVAKTGFDVKAMEVNVTNVSFHDQDAVATVSFVPKGGTAQSAVTFKYNLHREKDEWVATGLAQGGSGMGAHTGAVPPVTSGGIDMGSPDSGTPRPLPSGHPPIGNSK